MIKSPAAILYDASGNPLAVADDTAIPGATKALLIAARSADGKARFLNADEDGVVSVSNRLPTAPPGTTPVTIAQPENELSIAGGVQNPHDTEYTIANGKTFKLQLVAAGGGGDPTENGSRVDVVYYDGTAEHIVTRLYVGSASVFQSFPDSGTARDGTAMVGDGSTKKIILRRIRLSQATLEVDAEIRGFEE